jgi:hypothetical protein
MRQQTPICPEAEDDEEVEDRERIWDPHGENLRWSKRGRLDASIRDSRDLKTRVMRTNRWTSIA